MSVSIIASDRLVIRPGKVVTYDQYRIGCDLCDESLELWRDDFVEWAYCGDGVHWQRMKPNWDACPKHEAAA